MNYVFLNGYVQTKSEYMNVEGQNEFRFFVSTKSLTTGDTYAIPIKAIGKLADELYAGLKDKYYVEVLGELIRKDLTHTYVLARELTYVAPKSKTAFYVKSSEFLELFSPKQVLERMKNEKK